MSARSVRRLPENEWLRTTDRRVPGHLFRYPVDPASQQMRAIVAEDAKQSVIRPAASAAFEVSCRVEVPAGVAGAQVLLLVQFPGRASRETRCTATLDGREAPLEHRDSAGHVGFFASRRDNAWKDALVLEVQWSWYICRVEAGSHEVRFRGAASHDSPKIGLWLWSERELAARAVAGVPCPAPDMPQVRDRVQRQGVCLSPPSA